MKHIQLFRRAIAPVVAAVMLLGAANQAAAATYSFGDLLPGQIGPDDNSIWATLDVTKTSNKTYTFNLSVASTNFTNLFGSTAFISRAVFDTTSNDVPSSTSFLSGGVSTVVQGNAAGAGGYFNFGDCFGEPNPQNNGCNHSLGSGRLTAGESVRWMHTFSNAQGDPLLDASVRHYPVALHVQSYSPSIYNPSNQTYEDSAWYGPAPIPEPETYAMLLAGLGLLGLSAHRRKQST